MRPPSITSSSYSSLRSSAPFSTAAPSTLVASGASCAVAGWHAAVRGEGDVSNLPLHEIAVPAEGLRIAALLVAAGLMPSNSEANRKLKERAVRVDGAVFEDAARVFSPGFEGVIAVGKRNFARVHLRSAG